MEYLKINGNSKLNGSINLHGAKNSVLPILSATILTDDICVLHNCPKLSDVEVTVNILRYLGANVTVENNTITVNSKGVCRSNILEKYMKELRSSIIFLGALASRTGEACLYLPGGCEIGLRPIDLHLKGLKALGYNVYTNGHDVCACKQSVVGTEIVLPFPSVGATENIILASVMAKGTTTIVNAAREPEIEDLANFLNKCGAKIFGASTTTITIQGVQKLHGTEHSIISDRILATTLMCATAITSGDVEINKVNIQHIRPTLPVFREMGVSVNCNKNSLRITAKNKLSGVRFIETMAYPGFPTDCQATVMAALTIANGTSLIKENIFENRFMCTEQLKRFGADITVNDRIAIINGVATLTPADAECTDLRGGAALVVSALSCDGVSTIKNINHIDHGYEKIESQLSVIGADIKRIKDEKEET